MQETHGKKHLETLRRKAGKKSRNPRKRKKILERRPEKRTNTNTSLMPFASSRTAALKKGLHYSHKLLLFCTC